MSAANDPRSLSLDQREFLEAFEEVALLPEGLSDDEILDTVDHALTLTKARVTEIKGRDQLTDEDLIAYEKGFRLSGHGLAADGVARLLQRLAGEIARKSAEN